MYCVETCWGEQSTVQIYERALKMLIAYERAKQLGHAHDASTDQMRQDWADAEHVLLGTSYITN